MASMLRMSSYAVLLTCCLAGLFAHAAEMVAPDVLAKSVTEDVLAIVRADADIQAGDTRKAAALIESTVLPHFNFWGMTQLAMGRHWRQASPDQRTELTREFQTLLVHTYASALTLYRGQTIEYRPLRLAPGDTDATVRSAIRQARGEPVSVDYRMQKTAQGWKIYDFSFAGVSMMLNYRSTFASEIRRNGIDGLIRTLAEKNKALAGVDATRQKLAARIGGRSSPASAAIA